jgi:hypothetical protein
MSDASSCSRRHILGMTDLKGRTVGVSAQTETPRHLVSIMASYIRRARPREGYQLGL